MSDSSLYEILKGSWILHKSIRDRFLPSFAQMIGKIIFTPHPEELNTLIYQETGTFTHDISQGESWQTYLYRFQNSHMAELYFSDNRFFHRLDLKTGIAHVSHLCGEDVYKGWYHLIFPSHLEIRWTATGPRKDYEMTSSLSKIA